MNTYEHLSMWIQTCKFIYLCICEFVCSCSYQVRIAERSIHSPSTAETLSSRTTAICGRTGKSRPELEQITILPSPELSPSLVYTQQQLEIRVTLFELAIICPVALHAANANSLEPLQNIAAARLRLAMYSWIISRRSYLQGSPKLFAVLESCYS